MWDELLDPDRNWGIVPKSQNKPFIEACKTFKEYPKNKEESSMSVMPKYCLIIGGHTNPEVIKIDRYKSVSDDEPTPNYRIEVKGTLEKGSIPISLLMPNLTPKKIIFNDPATIVMWEDGTKTVVKCGENDIFDAEKGLALCFMKKAINNDKLYKKILRDGCKDYEPFEEPCLLPSIEGASKIVQDFFSMLNFLGGQE